MSLSAVVLGGAFAVTVAMQPEVPAGPERLVRVYATASDERGAHVEDLRPADLRLLERGTERTIESVRFIDAPGTLTAGELLGEVRSRADEQVEAARDGARLFAFLLDEYHVAAGPAADRVRHALGRFVEQHLGPRDLVLVFKPLDSLFTIRLTRDHGEVRRAIAAFEGRKGVYEPRNTFEREFLAADPGRIERVRAQISLAALNALVAHLGSLDSGRKALVVVSEGLAASAAAPSGSAPSLDRIARAAHRAGVSIYPFDPRVPNGSPNEDEARHRFQGLADTTEGRATFGADAVDGGLRQMAQDLSRYYVVTFNSAAAGHGEFHPVQVTSVRPGVAIKASRGHWTRSSAPEPGSSAGSAAAIPDVRPFPSAVRRTSVLIRPWFGYAPAGDGLSRITFVWEPALRVPVSRADKRIPARVLLRVSSADGTAIFDGVVTPVAPGSGGNSRAVFVAPSGRLSAEMRIEDESSAYLDADVRDILVGGHDGPVALGTPRVFRTRNARELRAIEGDPDAAPVAAREFSRAERLLIRVPVSSGAGESSMTAALVTRLGRVMRTLQVSRSANVGQFELPLAGLAAGEYRLEIAAEQAGRGAKEAVAFRVTP